MSYHQDVQQYASNEEDTLQSEAMRKLFVGGLKRETTTESFSSYFSNFGNIVDNVIITDPNTQQSRGFGFVTFENSDSVQEVFKTKPHTLDGKVIDVKRAMPREFNTPGAHSKTTRLFIGGFKGSDLEPDELREYIESRHPTSFGRLDNIDFLKEKDSNQNKGFGFLECSDSDFADRLAISESSFTLKGRKMSIKKAEPKDGQGGQQGSRGGFGGGRGGGGGGGGGGAPQRGRGGRGGGFSGRGGRGGGRSGFNSSGSGDNYQNYGGGSNTGYDNHGGNQGGGYNQGNNYNQGGSYNQGSSGGYNQQQGNYNNQGSYSGYNQQQTNYNNQSYGNSGSYNQQQPQQAPQQGYGGYGQNNYNSQNNGYSQSYGNYNNQSNNSGGRGGRGAGRGGGATRFQPY